MMLKFILNGDLEEGESFKIESFSGKLPIKISLANTEKLEKAINEVKLPSGEDILTLLEELQEIKGNLERKERFIKNLARFSFFSEQGAKEEFELIENLIREAIYLYKKSKEKAYSLEEFLFRSPVGKILWRPANFTFPSEFVKWFLAAFLSGNHLMIIPRPEDYPQIYITFKELFHPLKATKFLSVLPLQFVPREEILKGANKIYLPENGMYVNLQIERRGISVFLVTEKDRIKPAIKKGLNSLLNFYGLSFLNPSIFVVKEELYFDLLSELLPSIEELNIETNETIQSRALKFREKLIEKEAKFLLGGLVENGFKFPAVVSEVPLDFYIKEEINLPLLMIYKFNEFQNVMDFLKESISVMQVSIFGEELKIAKEILKNTGIQRVRVGDFDAIEESRRIKGREWFNYQNRDIAFLIEEFSELKSIRLNQLKE